MTRSTSSSSPAPTRCSAPDWTSRNRATPPNCPDISEMARHDQAGDGAINGAAVTGGVSNWRFRTCDVLIASENVASPTPTPGGIVAHLGPSVRLPQKVGVGLARRMSPTGDYLSAGEALRAGLVTEGGRSRRSRLPPAGWPPPSSATTRRPCGRCWVPSPHRCRPDQCGAVVSRGGRRRGRGCDPRPVTTSPRTGPP